MADNKTRKKDPMILIATASLTLFSLMGSAAITGLIPTADSGQGRQIQRTLSQHTLNTQIAMGMAAENLLNTQSNCLDCGTIVSIKSLEQVDTSTPNALYVINIRMEDGSQRTIRQYQAPQYSVGDQIRVLNNIQRVNT